jgi:hypothetical protein
MLRSAVGERGQWSRGAEKRVAERSRSATPAAEPQTEASRSCGHQPMQARDERAVLRSGAGVVERVTGRRAARGAKQTVRWSRSRVKSFVVQDRFLVLLIRGTLLDGFVTTNELRLFV